MPLGAAGRGSVGVVAPDLGHLDVDLPVGGNPSSDASLTNVELEVIAASVSVNIHYKGEY